MYVLRRCHGRGLLVGSKPPMASEVRRGRGPSSAERRAVRSILVVISMIRAGMFELPMQYVVLDARMPRVASDVKMRIYCYQCMIT